MWAITSLEFSLFFICSHRLQTAAVTALVVSHRLVLSSRRVFNEILSLSWNNAICTVIVFYRKHSTMDQLLLNGWMINVEIGAPVTMATHERNIQRAAVVSILIQTSENTANAISQKQVALLLSASARLEAYWPFLTDWVTIFFWWNGPCAQCSIKKPTLCRLRVFAKW